MTSNVLNSLTVNVKKIHSILSTKETFIMITTKLGAQLKAFKEDH